jgi:hypothetical protein
MSQQATIAELAPAYIDDLSPVYILTEEMRRKRMVLTNLCILFRDEPASALFTTLCQAYDLALDEMKSGFYRNNSSFNKNGFN